MRARYEERCIFMVRAGVAAIPLRAYVTLAHSLTTYLQVFCQHELRDEQRKAQAMDTSRAPRPCEPHVLMVRADWFMA